MKGEKGDVGRGSVAGVGGIDTSVFPAGFVEGPQGPPGRKVSWTECQFALHELHALLTPIKYNKAPSLPIKKHDRETTTEATLK